MSTSIADVKTALTEGLTDLHLPTVRRCYEDSARLAERETLSYERYLWELSRASARIAGINESSGCCGNRGFLRRKAWGTLI